MSKLDELCRIGASREEVYEAALDEIESLRQQLSAALAACKVKDEALQSAISAHGYESGDLHEALAIQPDDSAIKEWLDQAWCRDPDQ
jgi:methionine salvage enolase-phosphatase E1